jgi:hypothetical protein
MVILLHCSSKRKEVHAMGGQGWLGANQIRVGSAYNRVEDISYRFLEITSDFSFFLPYKGFTTALCHHALVLFFTIIQSY